MAPKKAVAVAAAKPKAPKVEKVKKVKAEKKDKVKREPSPYNVFIKTEIARIKAANPNIGKEAFKLATSNWAKSPENPKNKK